MKWSSNIMKRPKPDEHNSSDIVIIGGGIGGLAVAIHLAELLPQKSIILISKDKPGESNSRYAQGGVAAVMNHITDSFEKHITDTLNTGDGLCDPQVVDLVVRDAPLRLKEVITWGTSFDYDDRGNIELGLEGGHTASRIVHAKDQTGFVLVNALLRKLQAYPQVQTRWETLAVDMLTSGKDQNQVCCVAVLSKEGLELQSIQASVIILATGGAGQVYPVTTNPAIATGDGIAMAYRIGATIADMEFIQFHPTALKISTPGTPFLISEAVRGAGAYLVTAAGNRFMFAYDKRGELAPRDVVARAIYTEMKTQNIYLDCRHISAQKLTENFPAIYKTCLRYGFDLGRDLVPVTPAAHYICGGIVTNKDGQTTIPNLYAIGECARTGLHGANRLASNSILEALVFAYRCAIHVASHASFSTCSFHTHQPVRSTDVTDTDRLNSIHMRIQQCVHQSAGIVRTNQGIQSGLETIVKLESELEEAEQKVQPNWVYYEVRNLLIVARLILKQALQRTENRGTHFNTDLVTHTKMHTIIL